MPLPKITRRRQREAAPASLDDLFVGWLMAHPGGEFEVCRHCQLEMTKSIDLRPCYGPAPPHGVPPGPMWVWTCSCGFEFPGRELTLDECADECHAAATILFSRDSQVAAPLPLSFPVFGSIAYVVVVPIQEAEPGSEPEEPDPESTIEPTIEPMNEQDGPAACLDGHSVRRCRFPLVVLTSKQHARTDARTNTTTTR